MLVSSCVKQIKAKQTKKKKKKILSLREMSQSQKEKTI